MSGNRISKADLIRLARTLGDQADLEDESMVCIFSRCIERAEELGAPARAAEIVDDDEEEDRKEHARRQDMMVNHCLHTHCDGTSPECPDCGQSLRAVVEEDRQRFEGRLQLATDDVNLESITFGDEVPSIAVMPIENPTDDPITLECGGRRVTIEPRCVQNVTVARGQTWRVVPTGEGRCDHKFVDSNACLKCGWSPIPRGGDRRENAEQWAKTRGSKGTKHA